MSTTTIRRLPDGTNLTEDNIRAANARHTRDAMDRMGQLAWRDVLYAEVANAFATDTPEALKEALSRVESTTTQWLADLKSRLTP